MRRWAYKTVYIRANENISKELNKHGEQGWEAYSTQIYLNSYKDPIGTIVFLKRPEGIVEPGSNRL